MAKQREFGLDLTRAAAATLVLSVHFFLNNGFYELPLQGVGMTLAAMVRMACMTCVPLFIMLTGWLCIDRRWSLGYFLKLLPILLTYVLAGCACMAFDAVWNGIGITPLDAVRRLLNFSAAPYAWYLEVYLVLFLLAPFLNAVWRRLDGGRGRLVLVIALLVVTAMPALLNFRRQLVPDRLGSLYLLTYYFLGAWLREHPVRGKAWMLILGWLGMSVLAGGLLCMRRQGELFLTDHWNYYQSPLVVGASVCLFSLLARCKGTGVPAPARRCIGKLSQLSLPLYLFSYITDRLLYPHLKAAVPDMLGRLSLMPVAVLAGLLGSGVMAQLADWVVKALMRLVPKRKE